VAGGVREANKFKTCLSTRLERTIRRRQCGGFLSAVNISFFAAQRNDRGVAYCAAKSASDHMAACMAHELREYNVAAVALYTGLVRTESVLKANFDMSNSESPQFIGRTMAALAADSEIMKKSGQILVDANLALEYGFTDIDGRQPRPLSLTEE
jgi:dehydrogenase/reductase SDR family member 1